MKYILLLGIEYKKYKKPAKLTISVGETFIYMFELENDCSVATEILKHIDKKKFEKFNKLNWLTKPFGSQVWQDMPKFFKIYEIDSKDIRDVLRIDVENDNSDYNNGFMKNSSLLKLPIVSLFPKCIVQEDEEKLMELCVRMDNSIRTKYLIRNNLDTYDKTTWSWPTAGPYLVKRKNEKFSKSGAHFTSDWIGGSFTAEYRIRQKHKIKYLGSMLCLESGFPNTVLVNSLVIASCKPLLNIYNEDQ